MRPDCQTMQALLSGYVDDELRAGDRARVDDHVETCAECRAELESMRAMMEATSHLRVAAPPEEVWDTFLDDVYNRLERRSGWFVFIAGLVALIAFCAYHYVIDPWATPAQKVMVGLPIGGMGILFLSVLRQRMFVAKTDRYSRDVKR